MYNVNLYNSYNLVILRSKSVHTRKEYSSYLTKALNYLQYFKKM